MMKNSDADLYDIDSTQIDLSDCIETEAENELSDYDLDILINKTISKLNPGDSIRIIKHWRPFYLSFPKLAAIILVVLALSTTTVFAISIIKNIVPGKGLVDATNGNYLILNESKVIQENGYEIEFINITFDGQYLEVKTCSPYLDYVERKNGHYIFAQVFLYTPDGERVGQFGGATEYDSETLTQKYRFITNNIEGYYFSVDKIYSDLDDTEKVIESDVFTIPLSEFSLEPALAVSDKSELGKFSTNNGISLLAYSDYIDNQQHINVIFASEKPGEELYGFGSVYKDNTNAITLSDRNETVYNPINKTDFYGLYSSFVFDTQNEVLGEISIPDITVTRQLENQIEIPLPKENETIMYNKSIETSEGEFIIEKVERKSDTSDKNVHLNIYVRNPVLENNDVLFTTDAHIDFNSAIYYSFSPVHSDGSSVFTFYCDRSLLSFGDYLALSLDKIYVNVNGNWELDVNKSEDVFKNEKNN